MSSAIKQVSRKSDLYCIQLQYEQPVYMSMLLITTDNSAPYPSICTNKQESGLTVYTCTVKKTVGKRAALQINK